MREWYADESYPNLVAIGLYKIECCMRSIQPLLNNYLLAKPIATAGYKPAKESPACQDASGKFDPSSIPVDDGDSGDASDDLRTSEEIDLAIGRVAAARLNLDLVRKHAKLLVESISSTITDAAPLELQADAVMLEKLTRYERRSSKLKAFLKQQQEALKVQDKRLSAQKMKVGAEEVKKRIIKKKKKWWGPMPGGADTVGIGEEKGKGKGKGMVGAKARRYSFSSTASSGGKLVIQSPDRSSTDEGPSETSREPTHAPPQMPGMTAGDCD